MTTVTIHQPMYLPYQGIFNKMKNADIFVFLDDAEYSSGYYFNRNRIKGPNGEIMLTVPVMKKKGIKLNEIEIAQNIHWQEKHWKSLVTNYEKSGHFKDYSDFFEGVYSKKWKKLHDINTVSTKYLMEQLDIDVPYYFSSDLQKDVNLSGTERLVDLCKRLNAKTYLSGISGKDYLETGLFEKESIQVEFQDYKPVEYAQLFPSFIPNLSTVDLLFNMGEEAKNYI